MVTDQAAASRNRQAAETARRRDRQAEWRRVRDLAEAQTSPIEPVRLGRDVEASEWRDPEDTNPNRREPRRVRGHRRVDVLYHLHHSRKMLTRRQAAAGVRLRDDYEIAHGAKPGAERSEVRGGGELGPAEAQLAAVARYRDALKAIGPVLMGIVLHVVIDNRPLVEWVAVRRAMTAEAARETVYAVSKRARAQLIDGLDRLDEHYGDRLTLEDEERLAP